MGSPGKVSQFSPPPFQLSPKYSFPLNEQFLPWLKHLWKRFHKSSFSCFQTLANQSHHRIQHPLLNSPTASIFELNTITFLDSLTFHFHYHPRQLALFWGKIFPNKIKIFRHFLKVAAYAQELDLTELEMSSGQPGFLASRVSP